MAFSEECAHNDRALKRFLHSHMYRHYRVNRMTSKARRVVKDLFALADRRAGMPAARMAGALRWTRRHPAPSRVVSDYIAGMTDGFALDEHRRLFDLQSAP